jgi:hypothetical protein
MNYSFAIGFDLVDRSLYGSLSNLEREQARSLLFKTAQSVRDQMGEFDVADPGVKLDELLGIASSAGSTWRQGAAQPRGIRYYEDPVTHVIYCVEGSELTLNGAPYFGSVDVGGTQIVAAFEVHYSANNGPALP